MTRDPFQILGVSPQASEDEIKAAYRKLAKKYHPDLHPDSVTAEAKMKEINEAYTEALRIKKGGGAWYQGGGYGTQGYSGSAYQGRPYADPNMQAVNDYIMTARYSEALALLNSIYEQNAEWHYLYAIAENGLGNLISAIRHAQLACQMEPGNPQFRQLLEQLRSPAQEYRQHGAQFGFMDPTVCRSPFLGCLLANVFCNCFCNGCGRCI